MKKLLLSIALTAACFVVGCTTANAQVIGQEWKIDLSKNNTVTGEEWTLEAAFTDIADTDVFAGKITTVSIDSFFDTVGGQNNTAVQRLCLEEVLFQEVLNDPLVLEYVPAVQGAYDCTAFYCPTPGAGTNEELNITCVVPQAEKMIKLTVENWRDAPFGIMEAVAVRYFLLRADGTVIKTWRNNLPPIGEVADLIDP